MVWTYQCINYVVAILEQTRWTSGLAERHVTQLALNGLNGAWTHNLISMISEMPSPPGHIHKKGGWCPLLQPLRISHSRYGGEKLCHLKGVILMTKKSKASITLSTRVQMTQLLVLRGYCTPYPKKLQNKHVLCSISKLSTSFWKIIHASYSKLSKELKNSIKIKVDQAVFGLLNQNQHFDCFDL